MMPNSCSIYDQILPKKARPQNGTGFDTGNVIFYKHLFSPNGKVAPTGAFIARWGLCYFCVCSEMYAIIVSRNTALGVSPAARQAALKAFAKSRFTLHVTTAMFAESHLLAAARWALLTAIFSPPVLLHCTMFIYGITVDILYKIYGVTLLVVSIDFYGNTVYNKTIEKNGTAQRAERKITMKKNVAVMTRQAEERVKAMSDNQLLTVWESTENQRTRESSIIRGWLMDEIERRYPDAFDAWLDNDAYDSELRDYINNAE